MRPVESLDEVGVDMTALPRLGCGRLDAQGEVGEMEGEEGQEDGPAPPHGPAGVVGGHVLAGPLVVIGTSPMVGHCQRVSSMDMEGEHD